MDLTKIKGITKSTIIHADILNNTIGIGDLVAVAYNNTMHYGIVEKTDQKYLKILDKKCLDNGKNLQIGRAITGKQCLIINKEFDKSTKQYIKNKVEENTINNKKAKPKTKYKVLFKYINFLDNSTGLLLAYNVEKNKTSLYNKIESINKKYNNNLKLYIYNIDENFIPVDTLYIKDIQFYSLKSYVFSYTEDFNRTILKDSLIQYINGNFYFDSEINFDEEFVYAEKISCVFDKNIGKIRLETGDTYFSGIKNFLKYFKN